MMERRRERPCLGLLREVARLLIPWLAVMAAAAGALRFLNTLPSLLRADIPSEKRLLSTVEEGEREVELKLLLPAYFPDYLAWPPVRIEASPHPFQGLTLYFNSRTDLTLLLILQQVMGDDLPPSPELMPELSGVEVRLVQVARRPARLSSGLDKQGERWRELLWWADDRFIRLLGRLEERDLFRMARSIHRKERAPPPGGGPSTSAPGIFSR